ncbi:hypothetical protein OAU50_03310 [Planctomycetota bacterium]|nr:hypothetical protein [Planctomycetota bacterium]
MGFKPHKWYNESAMPGLYPTTIEFWNNARVFLFGLLVCIFVFTGGVVGYVFGEIGWLSKKAPELVGILYALGLSVVIVALAVVKSWLSRRRIEREDS